MIYRPQFAYPTPDGFRDQDSDQFFDSVAVPQLAAGGANPIYSIPLTLDPDAEFRWRGVKFDHVDAANIGVRFRDPWNNYLSDDFIPIWLAFISPSSDELTGGQCCVFEPEIICPAKSVVFVDFISYDTVPWLSGGPSPIVLCGVKRFPISGCGGCS